MSLIHDALKKAQDKEQVPLGSGMVGFQDPLETPSASPKKRILFLVVLIVAAVGIFGYLKFWSSKEPKVAAPQTPATTTAAAPTAGQDVGTLKKGAVEAYNAEDLERAWNNLSAANRLDEKDPEVWNNMGIVSRKRGDLVKAREAYQKAIELRPEYPEALNNLAVLSLQAGDTAQASELLGKALKISPAYPEANFHMGLLLEQKGDKAKAIEYYKRFLQVGGGLPSSVVDQVRGHVVEMEQ